MNNDISFAISIIGTAAAIAMALIIISTNISNCNQSSHRKEEVISAAKGNQCTHVTVDGFQGVQCKWDDQQKDATIYVVYRRNVASPAER
jgi:predicted small secreted protein